MTIQQNIITVLENYLDSQNTFPKAVNDGKHFVALSTNIPENFKTWIQKFSPFPDDYIVKYSHGMGNWAEIPWILCTNKNITLTPQAGYYIVLGFSADMQSCFLSLNQGVSKTNKKYLTQFAHIAIEYTKPSDDNNVYFGPIDFKAQNKLGKSYSQAAIKSYEYTLDELKKNDLLNKIEKQFKELLFDYEKIYSVVGAKFIDLPPIYDSSYQQEIQKNENDIVHIFDHSTKLPKPNKSSKILKHYLRNPKYSKSALFLADYKCELDPGHLTFSNGKHPYMEGHHLIPMSQQDKYETSLDVPANIVSLCPTCHRALHYGDYKLKKKLLEFLFNKRKKFLDELDIIIDIKYLNNIYTKNLLNNSFD